jgi:F-type H+/Na+-transporting ATPase subunit beta
MEGHMDKINGKLLQIIGPVVDIRFSGKQLPSLYSAIDIPLKKGKLVVEVAQHIGDDVVRCISMGSTDGLVRGMEAIDTGKAISVPVGKGSIRKNVQCFR